MFIPIVRTIARLDKKKKKKKLNQYFLVLRSGYRTWYQNKHNDMALEDSKTNNLFMISNKIGIQILMHFSVKWARGRRQC